MLNSFEMDLTSPASFKITKRAGKIPTIIGDVGIAGLGQFIEFYSEDGDVTKDKRIRFFGKGRVTDGNVEGLQIGWDPTNLEYYINTDKGSGDAVFRPLDLYATNSDNRGQWLLNVDGSISSNAATTFAANMNINADLTVTGTVVLMANLPLSDPSNTGQLWNNGGVVTVS